MATEFINIIRAHKNGHPVGAYSVCSANRFVLEATMKHAAAHGNFALIESTSNQVDQFGGYTGMRPEDFARFVRSIAQKLNFPAEKVILGGDHLGPNAWRDEDEPAAMKKARDQIAAYVRAGYAKIHLDASMHLASDDTGHPLPARLIARRTVALCRAAEKAARPLARKPVYVIGSDVPAPGGAGRESKGIRITPPEEVAETIDITREYFIKAGLEEAWRRVVAVVVQPGVEFTGNEVFYYDRSKALPLSLFIEEQPRLVYEAHSTDYQTRRSLKHMVEDHFAILKVGPWLTFALREALFALEAMEREWLALQKSAVPSNLRRTLLREMRREPRYWNHHFQGSAREIDFYCIYSLSDRIRYYWSQTGVTKALQQLLVNLKRHPAPLSLISQYLPEQHNAIVNDEITNNAVDLIHHKIGGILNNYHLAVHGEIRRTRLTT